MSRVSYVGRACHEVPMPDGIARTVTTSLTTRPFRDLVTQQRRVGITLASRDTGPT